jgi:hypothetical protein
VLNWTFSGTDRVLACPASAALPQAHSLDSSEDAEWGTGVHKYLRDCAVIGVEAARKALPKRAAWRSTCLALDPTSLWGNARHKAEWTVAYNVQTGAVNDLGTDLGRAYPEFDAEWLIGTLDLFVFSTHAKVYDYKTGHHPPRAFESGQLMLAALAMVEHFDLTMVTVGIVQIHEDGSRSVDQHTYEAWDLDDAREQVRAVWHKVQAARKVVVAGQVPDVTTGAHCRYCPAIHACPANVALVGDLVRAAEHTPETYRWDLLKGADAGKAWEQLQRAKRLLDEIERALKARCDHDGGLPLPDGSRVQPQTVMRESIDADQALGVLAELWGKTAAELRALFETKITKGSLAEVAKFLGKDPDAALGALRSVGAVPSKETTSYVTRKPKKEKAA